MIESEGTKQLKSVAQAYAKMKLAELEQESPEEKASETHIRAPESLDEKITTELTARQSKRLLGERLHRLAETISNVYVRTKVGEGEFDSPIVPVNVPINDKYSKHNEKIASMHENEIKSLGKEVDKFEKAIAKCMKNLNKADAIRMKE